MKKFTTSNLLIASYLILNGSQYEIKKAFNRNYSYFAFDFEEVNDLLKQYYKDKVIQDFITTFIRLKKEILISHEEE